MVKLSYLFLGLGLFALVNTPRELADRWRSNAVGLLSPVWQRVDAVAEKPERGGLLQSFEIASLRSEIETLQKWMEDERRLQERAETLAALFKTKDAKELLSDSRRLVQKELQYFRMRSASTPARVIFREASSWSSSLWISVGEADNRALGRIVVAPNSPVIANDALIGVVEYVGSTQSRVRLITDAGLVPAVRAVRGSAQTRELLHHVDDVLTRVQVRGDLFSSVEEQERFVGILTAFKSRLFAEEEEKLAKGQICGSSAHYFQARGAILKGSGFNYDFADDEGPALDLRSGRLPGVASAAAHPLIQQGDLLVTSGLDGIFPAGIPVAVATKIMDLGNGSFTYDLEARPAAGDMMDLGVVFVLPPLCLAGGDLP